MHWDRYKFLISLLVKYLVLAVVNEWYLILDDRQLFFVWYMIQQERIILIHLRILLNQDKSYVYMFDYLNILDIVIQYNQFVSHFQENHEKFSHRYHTLNELNENRRKILTNTISHTICHRIF
jgi:hypothetical protein